MTGTLTRPPSGLFIDGWRVVKELGNGGFAVVYLVEKNGQRRALKVARHRQASGDDKQTHARVMRELTALLMLMEQGGHPNIVQSHGHGYTETGNVYLVLDYVDGWTLDEWKVKKHPTFREILRVIAKVAAALLYMHGLGILHRDLKLLNVIIRKSDGEPIIIDFSCVTYTQARALTESGLPPGTDCFRAPQQFEHLRQYKEEHRARYAFQVADEIFAVGAMLYELLTDPRPTEVRPRETLNNPRAMPAPACKRNPRVPEALSDLVDDMLAREPAKRPVDFAAVGREVAELLADPEAGYDALAHPPSEQRQPAPPDREQPGVLEPASKRRWPALGALRGGVIARVPRLGKVLVASSAAVALAAVVALWSSPRVVSPMPPAAPPAASALDMSPPAPEPVVGTGLAPVPVQKEGSTVKTPPPESSQQARAPRGQKTPLTPDVKKALALGCAIATGCTGAQVRPEPFNCPEGAIAARKQLHWGDAQRIIISIDDRHPQDGSTWLRPGDTVIGVAVDNYPGQVARGVPGGTRFFGGKVYVWLEKTEPVAPAQIFVRYERVKLPGQEELPFCLTVETEAVELRDGAAKVGNQAVGHVADYWPIFTQQ